MHGLLSSRVNHHIARLGILLLVAALVAAIAGCPAQLDPEPAPTVRYDLTVSSSEGGSVASPGEGTLAYDEGESVLLVAEPDEGYRFVDWTGDVGTIANVNAARTTIGMTGNYEITAKFEVVPPTQHTLTISSTAGGSVTTPGEGPFTYNEGTVVDLVAEAEEGYVFIGWTGDVTGVVDIDAASTSIAAGGHHFIAANFAKGIYSWYDLDTVRNNLSGSYVLMNDLGCTAPGYAELAGPTANDGMGWAPIGTWDDRFLGRFDGQGFEIGDLFVYRPEETCVALFAHTDDGGVVENLGVVNAELTGHDRVASLVGRHFGIVSNCYFTGSVTGRLYGGALTGEQIGTVRNSYYNHDEVLINGENMITIGALFGEDFEQWLANDKFLDVNERLSQEEGYYVIRSVSDLKQLLAFGQDDSLRFRLKSNLDLGSDPGFYVPYLAGEFDGNGHTISNLSFQFGFVAPVGLIGRLAGGEVSELGVENVNVVGSMRVGGLVGDNAGGTVRSSYSTGRITGVWSVGGLIGVNGGTVCNSYSTTFVTGDQRVGGLIGFNHGIVNNSYYNHDEVLINGQKMITVGALLREDFDQWLSANKSLDVTERLSQENGYYMIDSVGDFRQLLAFGQDDSLKFRLKSNLDLGSDPGFYVPYLAGEFDGNGHTVSNLSFQFGFVAPVGLFGYLAPGGKIEGVGVENVNMTGYASVGGLVGDNMGGTVSNSYSTGSVTGDNGVGGLLGVNLGSTFKSYSTASVTGIGSEARVGGLVGSNGGTVSGCYSTGKVTCEWSPTGGLLGFTAWSGGTVSDSFWDVETSGQDDSDGGTGKATAEMKSIATFSGAGWNIVAVAAGEADHSRTWNIVNGQTYPFLSWQPVS